MGCRIVHKLYFNNSSSVLTYHLVVASSAAAVNLVDGKQSGERTGGVGSQAPAPPIAAQACHCHTTQNKSKSFRWCTYFCNSCGGRENVNERRLVKQSVDVMHVDLIHVDEMHVGLMQVSEVFYPVLPNLSIHGAPFLTSLRHRRWAKERPRTTI